MFINWDNMVLWNISWCFVEEWSSWSWVIPTPIYLYDYLVDWVSGIAWQIESLNLTAEWLYPLSAEQYIYFNNWSTFWVPVKARFKIKLDGLTGQSFGIWWFTNGRQANRWWFALWGYITWWNTFVLEWYTRNSNAWFLIWNEPPTPWWSLQIWQFLRIDVWTNPDNTTSWKISFDEWITRTPEQNIWWRLGQNSVGLWIQTPWTIRIQKVEVYNFADI